MRVTVLDPFLYNEDDDARWDEGHSHDKDQAGQESVDGPVAGKLPLSERPRLVVDGNFDALSGHQVYKGVVDRVDVGL